MNVETPIFLHLNLNCISQLLALLALMYKTRETHLLATALELTYRLCLEVRQLTNFACARHSGASEQFAVFSDLLETSLYS